MNELEYFKKIIFLICICISVIEPRKKYPRIQDVVTHLQDPNYITRAVEKIKSGLDLVTLRKNISEPIFRMLVRDNLETVLSGEKPSRRVYYNYHNPNDPLESLSAMALQFKTKVVDCMLQLVYMARHYFKLFERKEYVDKTTLAYRIGYICHKLRLLFKKSVKILEILNVNQMERKWKNYASVTVPLTLHHKVAKMNVDFEYYYIVLKRLHAKNVKYEPPKLHIKVYQLSTNMEQFATDP